MLDFMKTTIFAAALSCAPMTAFAQSAQAEDLFEALALGEVIGVMRQEGITYGDELIADFFPGRTIDDWDEVIALIYDEDTMKEEVKAAFSEALDGADVSAMLAFFNSPVGQEIIDLEISARRALMDEEIEQMAEENAAVAMQDETDRFLLVQDFVDVNNLIDSNVVGAMNSNFAFYIGLLEGGAFGQDLSEDQILADVWSREAEIRQSTTEWAFSFLMLAYQPLSDEELRLYTDFSKTMAGEELNTALFDAFDGMLERISRDLGLATSRYMVEQEL